MKRFWSLIIAVVMLFTVFALVSCEKENTTTSEATTAATTAAPTTAAPTTAAPTTAAPTTAAPTTAAPTTAAPTTAEPTTAAPTTAEPTTAEPTEATTTEATTKATGTTLPLYARFDFGTDSYAVQNGLTAHEYLMGCLTYSEAYLTIDVKEDSWKLWVMSDYVKGETPSEAYALKFDSVITYDYEFPDEGMFPGWGTWSKYPYTTANVGKTWVGRHQYMKVRLINNTNNNMIGIWWSASNSPGYFTTLRCSNLYLQGDITTPASGKDYQGNTWEEGGSNGKDPSRNHCAATTEYATYVYDIAFTNALASNRFGWGSGEVTKADGTKTGQESWCNTATFAEFVAAAKDPRNIGLVGANNWCAAAAEATGIEFFFFGAVDTEGQYNTDCRANAKQGSWVEVDYVVFGSSVDQVEAYKSNLERAEEA